MPANATAGTLNASNAKSVVLLIWHKSPAHTVLDFVRILFTAYRIVEGVVVIGQPKPYIAGFKPFMAVLSLWAGETDTGVLFGG
jgi:hypothetical protein